MHQRLSRLKPGTRKRMWQFLKISDYIAVHEADLDLMMEDNDDVWRRRVWEYLFSLLLKLLSICFEKILTTVLKRQQLLKQPCCLLNVNSVRHTNREVKNGVLYLLHQTRGYSCCSHLKVCDSVMYHVDLQQKLPPQQAQLLLRRNGASLRRRGGPPWGQTC